MPSTPQAELDRKTYPPRLLAHASRGNFPAEDHDGRRFEPSRFAALRSDLTQRFEGVTREHGKTVHDNIIIFEVMVESLDRDWWACLRKNLENEFVQDEILIRAASVEKL
jgi:hypothetical protein